jgi:adenylylsulfate kinase
MGKVIWFIGLSAAGKSTLCCALAEVLKKNGYPVQILDGDELREGLCSGLGFTEADRTENVRRIAHVARLLSSHGIFVLVAVISPFQQLRDMIHSLLPQIIEVFVDTPLAVCEQRDPKGLYRRARAGELLNFTGIDSPFEAPSAPDIVCLTDQQSIEDCVASLIFYIFGETTALPKKARDRRPTIAVDFDGVIAEYDGWQGEKILGAPRQDVAAALRQLEAEGWKVVVHTTRGAEDIHAYLVEAGIPFAEINTNSDFRNRGPKPVATVYWDDRAVTYTGNAHQDLPKIRAFRTWSGRA